MLLWLAIALPGITGSGKGEGAPPPIPGTFDTQEKRLALLAMRLPTRTIVTPNAAKDAGWRKQLLNVYGS